VEKCVTISPGITLPDFAIQRDTETAVELQVRVTREEFQGTTLNDTKASMP
jgi:hypothetical protein